MRELIVTVALQVGLLLAVHAQELPCRWNQAVGATIPNGVVADIGVLGDIDGDGVDDLVVGVKPHDFFAPPHADGFVELRSGADGALIRTIPPLFSASSFGMAVLVTDDLDGDGLADIGVLQQVDDIATSAVDHANQVHLFSSASGLFLGSAVGSAGQVTFAPTLACVTDLNGDGIREIAICGTEGGVGAPVEARFVDPLGLAPDQSLFPANGTSEQCSLIAIDDRDFDGVDDFLFSFGSAAGQQPVEVRSGSDLSLIGLLPGTGISFGTAGPYIRSAGDLNADGIIDFLYPDNFSGELRVRDSVTGADLESMTFGPVGNLYNPQAMGTLGDVDGDGFDDYYLISSFDLLRVFSGRLGLAQTSWEVRANLGPGVRALRAFGDLNGDGLDEFIVGVGDEVRMMSLGGARRFGPPLPLDLSYRTYGVFGSPLGALDLSGALPWAQGVIGLSLQADPNAVDVLIDVSPINLVALEPFGADFQGRASFGLNLAQPQLSGESLFVQAATWVPGGISTSNAVELLFVASRMTIAEITPLAVAGGETVTITGEGFDPNLQLSIGGQVVTPSLVSSEMLQFVAPAPTDFDLDLVLRNPQGESATAVFHPTPVLTLTGPTTGPAAGGAPLLLFGGPFNQLTSLTIGGNPATITSQGNGSLIAQAPPGSIGAVPFVLTFADPNGGVFTLGGTYTYF